MKVVSIHQPNYLPWLGYFHKMALSDIFVVLDSVPFEKNSFINRNKIKVTDECIWLTVPVLMKGKFGSLIKDVQINNQEDWRKKHWSSIYFNYKKAPYFKNHARFLEQVYEQEWISISELNISMIKYFSRALGIDTQILIASKDLTGIEGKKEELILNICRFLRADVYISGVLGKGYVDTNLFGENGIQVYFQNYQHPSYSQLYGNFKPNLSIIDLLLNQGNQSLNTLLEKNTHKNDLTTQYISK